MSQYAFPLEDTDYLAEQAQLWFSARTSGVYSSNNDLPATSVGGMRIAVGAGMAWLDWERFKGIVYANTDTVNLDLALADGALDRIDRVVVRYDIVANTVTLAIKQGALSANPVAPALQRDASAYEIALADIRVNRGTVEITQADIYDQRLNEAVCGVMRDGVTGIPTAQLQAQWEAWLAKIADIPLDETLADWLVARMLVVEESKMDKPTGTTNQILDGTGTPKAPGDIPSLFSMVQGMSTWQLIQSYTAAGVYNWVAPDLYGNGKPYEIGVYEMGAGGSGGAGVSTNNAKGVGGASGYTRCLIMQVTPGQIYNVVVGAKGAAAIATAPSGTANMSADGNKGGSTSFAGQVAEGGDGGRGTASSTINQVAGADGGQGSYDTALINSYPAPAMGIINPVTNGQPKNGSSRPADAINIFDGKKRLSAGGAAYASSGTPSSQIATATEDGGKGGDGVAVRTGTSVAGDNATGNGNGGGGAALYNSSTTSARTATSGAGSDGAVFIYARRVSA